MNRFATVVLLYLGLLIAVITNAQESPVEARVELSVEAQDTYWVGQQITVNLDLKTTGFSFSNTLFSLPAIDHAFLVQADTTTIKQTERLEGRQWQLIRYPLALFAQTDGSLEIPPISVSFSSSAGFGSEPREFEFQTDPLPIKISLPPGVKDGELVTSTTSMKLEYTWQGQTENARAGDAFTLTVKRRASDISAMLLPPLPVYRAKGLAVYPQSPELQDIAERGSLLGTRNDKIIWVAESAGSYEIPGIRFRWWDPDRQVLEKQDVPGIEFNILSGQDGLTEPENNTKSLIMRAYPYALTVLLIVSLAFVLRGKRATEASADVNDEKRAFETLKNACKQNQASVAYTALHNWLKMAFPDQRITSLADFARTISDSQLEWEVRTLQAMLVEAGEWKGGRLMASLKRIRRDAQKHKLADPRSRPVELNP